MLKDPLFKYSFSALVLIWILNHIGGYFDLYMTIWWYDSLLHFLGGLWLGLNAVWIYNTQSYVRKFIYRWSSLVIAVSAAICIGVIWEIYEYVFGIPRSPFMSYPLDVLKDLILDILGGVLAGWFASRFKNKN